MVIVTTRKKSKKDNDLGKFIFISEKEFNAFVNNEKIITGELQLKLNENYFIYDNRELFVEDAAVELRKYKSYLMVGTQLHIFVLTTYCNFRCIYCQASASDNHNNAGTSKIMGSDVAEKAVELALITDDMIKFLVDNNVVICTYIDGPEIIHNNNRVYSQGNCLEIIKKNIIKINE